MGVQAKGNRDFFSNFDEKTIPLVQMILDGMPGGFFIYHADSEEELLYANKGMLRIFGCNTEEEFRNLTGYTFKGMVHPDDIDLVKESITKQIADSVYDLDYVEYRIVRKDGSVRCVEDYGHFLRTEAYGDIFLVFMEDTTDRVEQNLSPAAMRRAELAKSAFWSNMSHDIRTPLNAIIGYTELVKSHIMEPDKVNEYNQKICVSGEQLLSVINETLEITRMESGKVDLVESRCNLVDLLLDVEKAMMLEMDVKSLDFFLDKTGVRSFAVIADYVRLKEILCQLLDNAVKYTNPGGSISLTVEEESSDLPDYGMYRFIVEDDGIGISKEFINSLFVPFKRENDVMQSGVSGAGLGLTVVKNMVDLMGGDIEVESEPGRGSRFTVSLRLKFQEGQNSDVMPGPKFGEDGTVGKRILLVDDNEINLEIARELLIAQGFLVESAENGSKALEMVEHSEPGYYDLILMDVQMPEMGGHEAAKAIRQLENKELAQIPIIALSANAFPEDYQKSMEAGMDAHSPKPFDIQELQELIQDILNKR